VCLMAVDNYKKWEYGAYYPGMVHLGSIWRIQAKTQYSLLESSKVPRFVGNI
jgi:hypothetical protein